MYGYSAGYGINDVTESIKLDSLYERLKPVLDRTDKYTAFPGKSIPYFGQWLPIDFDGKVMIGLHDDESVGLLPSNKWKMPWRCLSESEKTSIIYKLNGLANHADANDFKIFHEWVQNLKDSESWNRS